MRVRRPPGGWRAWWLLRRSAPWRRFQGGVALLVVVLAFGTTGYVVVGLGVFDAFYQTAITISTVGYAESGPADEIDRAYRTFTLVLVLVGAATVVYTASVLLETLVEGTLDDEFRRRRMQRQIDRMTGHVIVAGWGRVGSSVAQYAGDHGMDVVVVETDADVAGDLPVVVGDATDEDVLLAAGLERAASLIAALGSDNDNLTLTLTARSLRSDLLIVARVANARNERKFARAGADRVVNPYEIGGSRMAAIAFRPHVAEFLDKVIHGREHDIDIYEVEVTPGSPADGARLGDLLGEAGDVGAVVAVRDVDGGYVSSPPPDLTLAAGQVLIAVGTAAHVEELGATVTGVT